MLVWVRLRLLNLLVFRGHDGLLSQAELADTPEGIPPALLREVPCLQFVVSTSALLASVGALLCWMRLRSFMVGCSLQHSSTLPVLRHM